MNVLFALLLFLPFVLSAILPAPLPAITERPSPVLARAVSTANCVLTKASAFTLNGQAYSPSTYCSCNGGVQAGASSSVQQDGDTTWACAIAATPVPVIVEKSAPTPTWVVRVEVGSSSFMIGDYAKNDLKGLMEIPCDSLGCDGGSPQEFQFNWTTSAGILPATGTLTMDGFINQNGNIEQSLLKTINTVLLKTSSCKTMDVNYNPPGLLSPGVGSLIHLHQCRVVNFIQATLYDGKDFAASAVQAQMSVQGDSKDPAPLLCNEFLGDLNAALGSTPLPGFIAGGVTLVQAFCGA